MNIKIRQETPAEYKSVFNLVEQAFKDSEFADGQEQFLVERLRNSVTFIPELSLVAEIENQIVGYILLTQIIIKNHSEKYDSLALAPVAVHPNFQGKGIGGELILEAHKIAKELNHGSIVLLGHAEYYPKFGYKLAASYNIKLPFDVPDENCMIIELKQNALKNVSGVIEYPKEFFE